MAEILAELSRYPVKTRVMLTGPMVVARDIAHAKIKERLDAGEPMPEYLRDHCVYYAGPAKTPEGYASGSFGPTTAGRMDSYVEQFQVAGGSMVMLAKGNRSKQVTDACRARRLLPRLDRRPGGAWPSTTSRKVEVLEYPELGMEAVWKIEVVDFPAFIVVDDKGNDFFEAVRAKAGHAVGADRSAAERGHRARSGDRCNGRRGRGITPGGRSPVRAPIGRGDRSIASTERVSRRSSATAPRPPAADSSPQGWWTPMVDAG